MIEMTDSTSRPADNAKGVTNGNTPMHYYLAGAIGGMGGIAIGHPLDTTKVQLQIQQQAGTNYRGSWDAMSCISKQGLLRGFYRGLSFPLATAVIVNSVYYGVYGGVLQLLQRNMDGLNHTATDELDYRCVFAAGCVGGVVQTLFVSPAELVKVVLQSHLSRSGHKQVGSTQMRQYFRGPFGVTTYVVRRFGLIGLFRGYPILVMRDAPTYGLYAIAYEWLFHRIADIRLDNDGVIASLLAGGTAGIVAWTAAIPFDVIKSLMQADVERVRYSSAFDCAVQLYLSRGLRGFYAGLTVTCCRAFPVCAVTFLLYSQTLAYLGRPEQPFATGVHRPEMNDLSSVTAGTCSSLRQFGGAADVS